MLAKSMMGLNHYIICHSGIFILPSFSSARVHFFSNKLMLISSDDELIEAHVP